MKKDKLIKEIDKVEKEFYELKEKSAMMSDEEFRKQSEKLEKKVNALLNEPCEEELEEVSEKTSEETSEENSYDKFIKLIKRGEAHFDGLREEIINNLKANWDAESASENEKMHVVIMKMRKCDLKDFQDKITIWMKEYKMPELVSKILEEDPSKRTEIQKRILAFGGEGKTLENSCI